MSKEDWYRVTKKTGPCPICGKHDWCLRAFSDSAAICARTESDHHIDGSGWLHRLVDSKIGKPAKPLSILSQPSPEPVPEMSNNYPVNDCKVTELSTELGVSTGSLRRLCVGVKCDKWLFPMRDDQDRIIGFRTRGQDGSKRAIYGSKAGLFIPEGLKFNGTIVICEGPTDTAAALDLGYDAIGRPSCSGGMDYTKRFIWSHYESDNKPDCYIVADRDGPGKKGAMQLAKYIRYCCNSIKIVKPPKVKDLRAWVVSGATRTMFESVATNTHYFLSV